MPRRLCVSRMLPAAETPLPHCRYALLYVVRYWQAIVAADEIEMANSRFVQRREHMSPRQVRKRLLRPWSLSTAALGLLLAVAVLNAALLLAHLPARLAHSSDSGPSLPVSARFQPPQSEPAENVPRRDARAPGSIAAAQLSIGYSYDQAGRLSAVDYGNGTVISYTYDAGGNLLSREIAGAAPPATPTAHPQHGAFVYLPIAYYEN